ncbi:Interleukin-17F [Dissostichus eleginoides]|uniref:Interleukin-17F n=1 Tax=Dissostichus eleginoides TaxID=100907 RepID=A0AAD9F4X1_DISEL|nr:Interleukin-17F [Dissostichus eleginoides]
MHRSTRQLSLPAYKQRMETQGERGALSYSASRRLNHAAGVESCAAAGPGLVVARCRGRPGGELEFGEWIQTEAGDGSLSAESGISTSDSSIANMSLSPWTYRDSCVPSRWPRRISHAQCLTSGCLSLEGGGEDAALEARPIYYQVLVLHKILRQVHNHNAGGRKRRQFDFRLGTEVITVGCTCVRPSVIPQRP